MNSNSKKPVTGQKPQSQDSNQPINRQRISRPPTGNQVSGPPPRSRTTPSQKLKRPMPQQGPQRPKQTSGLSDNLKSQTPLQRQMRKQSAPSEPGTVRRTNTQYFKISHNGKKQKRTKRNRSFTKKVLLLGVIGYLILLPIALLIANLLLKANVMTSTEDFRYQQGEGKNTLWRKTYAYSRVCRDGVYYIDMDALADYCKLTTTGDGKNMRYVVRETTESVEFVIGESIAYINGVPDRTGGNAFIYGGKLHIPLEFARRCFLNLDISLDTENNKITIVRHTDDKGNYLALVFPFKPEHVSDRIIFGELEVDIQEQIIKQNQPTPPNSESNGDTTVNN